jgi:hypothetical protein
VKVFGSLQSTIPSIALLHRVVGMTRYSNQQKSRADLLKASTFNGIDWLTDEIRHGFFGYDRL